MNTHARAGHEGRERVASASCTSPAQGAESSGKVDFSARVLAALQGGPRAPRDLARELGVSPGYLRTVTCPLVESGALVSTGATNNRTLRLPGCGVGMRNAEFGMRSSTAGCGVVVSNGADGSDAQRANSASNSASPRARGTDDVSSSKRAALSNDDDEEKVTVQQPGCGVGDAELGSGIKLRENGVVWFSDRLYGHRFVFPFLEEFSGVPSSRVRVALDYKLVERAQASADGLASEVSDWPAFARGVLVRLKKSEVDTLMLEDDAFERSLRSTELGVAQTQKIVAEGRRLTAEVERSRGEIAKKAAAFRARMKAADETRAALEAKRLEAVRLDEDARRRAREAAAARHEAWMAQRSHV